MIFQAVKIKHHRGPVTALQVSTASDVLVSSSHDATICLWSLENFSLLNTIQLNGPILNIQISSDSVSFSLLLYPCYIKNIYNLFFYCYWIDKNLILFFIKRKIFDIKRCIDRRQLYTEHCVHKVLSVCISVCIVYTSEQNSKLLIIICSALIFCLWALIESA